MGYQAQMQQNGYQAQLQQNGYQSQMQQRVQQRNDLPFREIRFVTEEEAKAHIVMPNSSSLLIDSANKIAYVKSADFMGQSFMKPYRFEEFSTNNPQLQEEKVDLSVFAKNETIDLLRSELDSIKAECKKLSDSVAQLQKQPKISAPKGDK